MSEEAKSVYLQQKLKDMKSNMRVADILFFLGVAVSTPLYVMNYFFPPTSIVGLFLSSIILFVGAVVLFLGGVLKFYYRRKYEALMKQLKKTDFKIPKCPKCGKQIPRRDFVFCPYCGTSLIKYRKVSLNARERLS